VFRRKIVSNSNMSLQSGDWHYDGFVFIHINKTGGCSVGEALGITHEHRTALEKRAELGEATWLKKFTFAFVRNPWDKVVSQYHYRIRANLTNLGADPIEFNEWVKLAYGNNESQYYDRPKLFMPQLDWITDQNGMVIVNFVGRFEHIERDFDLVCASLKVKAELPHLNRSNRGPYRDYYNNESREIVGTWFKKDIEYFGYAF
jgi:chondroitin 4-sulfotransferase 11